MSTSPDLAAIALRELGETAALADGMTTGDYARPTALPTWTVEDLIRHVAGVAVRQAEAFHRARFTVADTPSDATIAAPVERLAPTLRAVLAHCAGGVDGLDGAEGPDDSDPVVPLPYASLPASLAAYVVLVEYGVHRYDLELALSGKATLAPDVAGAIVDRLDLTLPALAAPGEPPVDAIRLEPEDRPATALAWRSGRWTGGDDAEAGCVVRGPADALALFVVGRVTPADDDRLAAEDPAGALAHFKTMFPGP